MQVDRPEEGRGESAPGLCGPNTVIAEDPRDLLSDARLLCDVEDLAGSGHSTRVQIAWRQAQIAG